MKGWKLSCVGDSTIVLEFPQRVDPVVNARVLAVAETIRRTKLKGVRDIVESYCAVTIEVDPLQTDVLCVVEELKAAAADPTAVAEGGRELTLPVCYGGDCGPDLGAVAEFAACSEAEVVETHVTGVYRVYMLGFMPGFAYLGSVDSRIAMPRKATPRLRVPSGSVGIAGRQTGIYPLVSPGGWRLIGRSPTKPFDLARQDPFLLRVGDTVRFEAISDSRFRQLALDT